MRRLQHGTEYTCWFALQRKALRRTKGSLGHVQLRFSVHWSQPRRRLLQYLSPPSTVVLALQGGPQHTAEQARRLIEFARFGHQPDARYQWSTLDDHIKEVCSPSPSPVSLTRTRTLARASASASSGAAATRGRATLRRGP